MKWFVVTSRRFHPYLSLFVTVETIFGLLMVLGLMTRLSSLVIALPA
ncbi:MAG: TQO small subunit DoxD [Vulcanisaeta sp.]